MKERWHLGTQTQPSWIVVQPCLPLPGDGRWVAPGTEASRVFLYQIPEVRASFQE